MPVAAAPSAAPVPDAGERSAGAASLEAEGETWLGRVGIGFVVLAFAFLLKLSFDRGWITPALRLGAGFASGLVLLGVGLRLETARQKLAQALLGGGIALLYLTAFAGSQLYGLLPLWVAFSIMATTAVLAIVLSDRQDSPGLAIMGVVGGLATPFLLDVAMGNSGPVAVYVSAVLLGGAPVQFHRGWSTLLAVLVAGGGMVLAGIVAGALTPAPVLPVVGLLGLYWLITAPSPLVRPLARPGENLTEEAIVSRLSAALGTGVTAAAAAWYFELSRAGAGLLLLTLGLTLAGIAFTARKEKRSAAPAGDVAALAIAAGLVLLTWSQVGMLLVMAEVTVLLILTDRGASPTLGAIAHWLALLVAGAFLLFSQSAAPGGLLGMHEYATVRLAVLVLAAVTALWADEHAGIYRGAAYVGLLGFLYTELAQRPNGQAMVSVAWAIQGTVALLASLPTRSRTLQLGGLGTLGLVAGKLIVVDLAQLDPVIRIVIFLGFGGTLVGLGYLINRAPGRA